MKLGSLLLLSFSSTAFAINGWGLGGDSSGAWMTPGNPGRDPMQIALGQAFGGLRGDIMGRSQEIRMSISREWTSGHYRYAIAATWAPGDGGDRIQPPPIGPDEGPSEQDLVSLYEHIEEYMGIDANSDRRATRSIQMFTFYDFACRGGRIIINIIARHLGNNNNINSRNATTFRMPIHNSVLQSKPGERCKRSSAVTATICRDSATMVSGDSITSGYANSLRSGIGSMWVGGNGALCFSGLNIRTASCTGGSGPLTDAPYRLKLENDGNLCVYNKNNANTWCSGIKGKADRLY
ncbi:hypothetical protein BGZ80_006721, partial [Entomortierella chlamydospora]